MKMILAVLFLWAVGHAFAEPPQFRLGDAAAPRSYDLTIAVDPRQKQFEGEVRIELRVTRAMPILWLNAQDVEILEASFSQGGRRLAAKVTRAPPSFAGFEVEGGFEAGDALAEIRFRGSFENVGTRGLFRQEQDGQWYAITQFEAMDTRRAFPSFDEPQWKTPWRLTIDAPATDGAFANTPVERVGPAPSREGWRRHVFAPTKPLPTYLVAFGVGPFDVVDGGNVGARSTPLRYIVTSGRGHEAGYPRSATPALVAYLEDYFGSPFPYEKLDSLTIPSSVGFSAMENVGLITYGSNTMLRPPGREALAFKRGYSSLAAHEIAHQWFGDMVTMAWWNDIWLNEGFATWMARKTMSAVHPEWQDGWRASRNRRLALNADRLMSARRVANPVNVLNDMSGAFDAITYQKGAEVLSMFEGWMGPDRFRAGVRAYLDAHSHGSATSDDFLRAIGAASGKAETVDAFRTFLDQPGAPLIETRLRCDGGPPRLELSQRRFVPKGSTGEERAWITPACFHYAAQGRVQKACTEVRQSRTLALETKSCPAWVVGNADGAGHWLARLDAATFRKLVPNVTRLPEHDAVGVGVNTSLLLRTGLIPAADALEVAKRLLLHPAVGAKTSAIVMLEELRDGMLARADQHTVATLDAGQVMPLARKVGWRPKPGESLAMQDLREQLLPYAATKSGGEPLRGAARELARAWLRDHGAVDASAITQVLHTAARFADEPLFADLAAAIPLQRDRRDRADLIEALSAVRDPPLRTRAHELLLPGGALDGRDSLTFLRKGLGDKWNGEALFAFLRAHWDEVLRKLPPDSAAAVMREMNKLCTREARDRIVEFFEPRAQAMLGGPRAYQQTLESVSVCVAAAAIE